MQSWADGVMRLFRGLGDGVPRCKRCMTAKHRAPSCHHTPLTHTLIPHLSQHRPQRNLNATDLTSSALKYASASQWGWTVIIGSVESSSYL